jgi:lipoate-protein ligase A
MALDASLVNEARLYTWDGPWVSLGRFQKPERDVAENFQNWVKRPTGGKAVLHGHDLTVALATHLETETRNVRLAYQTAVQPILKALQDCGVQASFGQPHQGEARVADCFAATAGCDIVDQNGHKVCGCALLIQGNRVLLQASIPYKEPLIDPAKAISGATKRPHLAWNHENFAEALEKALRP